MHQFVFPMLGFLLVFRSRLAYQRYWDCRSALGVFGTSCRECASMAFSYIDPSRKFDDSPIVRLNMMRLLTAFYMYSTSYLHTRGVAGDHFFPLDTWLLETEQEALRCAIGSKPLLICQWIRRALAHAFDVGYVLGPHLRMMDSQVNAMNNAYSVLDRIMRTPVPLPYTQALEIVLAMYFVTLPFVFLPLAGVGLKRLIILPATMFIFSFTFYGLKSIALELEEPLGDDDNDLPLRSLASAVERDLLMLFADAEGLHGMIVDSSWPPRGAFEKAGLVMKEPSTRYKSRSILKASTPHVTSMRGPASRRGSWGSKSVKTHSVDTPKPTPMDPICLGGEGFLLDGGVKCPPPALSLTSPRGEHRPLLESLHSQTKSIFAPVRDPSEQKQPPLSPLSRAAQRYRTARDKPTLQIAV
eukprot:CAMPEP_0184659114 /NCGR_PEP_ID=MMETSP0308-20130426/28276_1 /TAXON_ID=38269 /ORGANISM="Gloeochaete witrockiana, Strain SAG 46.84" /LENGTH=412 /DNA_ID=CAMNT_0027098665 /DNA_START=363 /DNA_END=1601 /DNA_ORIENTATION=+